MIGYALVFLVSVAPPAIGYRQFSPGFESRWDEVFRPVVKKTWQKFRKSSGGPIDVRNLIIQ
jgi:hypothetical protein